MSSSISVPTASTAVGIRPSLASDSTIGTTNTKNTPIETFPGANFTAPAIVARS